GPALSGLVVESLGYRSTFALLAMIGALGTAIVVTLVPETLGSKASPTPSLTNGTNASLPELSTTP
ncbi:hypothetical protein ACYOEI_18370, partial [Singulisphaera rosea]